MDFLHLPRNYLIYKKYVLDVGNLLVLTGLEMPGLGFKGVLPPS
jgi:hypothetical protein